MREQFLGMVEDKMCNAVVSRRIDLLKVAYCLRTITALWKLSYIDSCDISATTEELRLAAISTVADVYKNIALYHHADRSLISFELVPSLTYTVSIAS